MAPMAKLVVCTMQPQQKFTLTVSTNELNNLTIGAIKERVYQVCGIPKHHQVIKYNGQMIGKSDNVTAAEVGLVDGSTIYVDTLSEDAQFGANRRLEFSNQAPANSNMLGGLSSPSAPPPRTLPSSPPQAQYSSPSTPPQSSRPPGQPKPVPRPESFPPSHDELALQAVIDRERSRASWSRVSSSPPPINTHRIDLAPSAVSSPPSQPIYIVQSPNHQQSHNPAPVVVMQPPQPNPPSQPIFVIPSPSQPPPPSPIYIVQSPSAPQTPNRNPVYIPSYSPQHTNPYSSFPTPSPIRNNSIVPEQGGNLVCIVPAKKSQKLPSHGFYAIISPAPLGAFKPPRRYHSQSRYKNSNHSSDSSESDTSSSSSDDSHIHKKKHKKHSKKDKRITNGGHHGRSRARSIG